MAKESMKARERKREATVAKYAEKRKALKEAGDFAGLQRLPKNASPVRLHKPLQNSLVALVAICANLAFPVSPSVRWPSRA